MNKIELYFHILEGNSRFSTFKTILIDRELKEYTEYVFIDSFS